MAKKAKKADDRQLTPEQKEMEQLRKIPRGERTAEQRERYNQLHRADCRERFRRLAGPRIGKAEKALGSLSQCGNRNAYDYTEEEAKFLIGRIERAMEELKDAFSAKATNGHTPVMFPWNQ